MNTPLRETLARRANDAGPPDLDIDALVGLGERRLRRRRLAAVLGSATGVIVVIALTLTTALHGSDDRGQEPVNHPTPSPTEKLARSTRELVYSDGRPNGSQQVHFGDRVVEVGPGFVHLDVTDDGFVYTSDARVWFSDGGRPEQVGSRLCTADRHGELGNYDMDAVVAAKAGSLVAWFQCPDSAPADLVVLDTSSRQEVVRRQVPLCAAGGCVLDAVLGGQVYFSGGDARRGLRHVRLDVATGRLSTATRRSYADDVKSRPRGLVVGDTWKTATPGDDGLTWLRADPAPGQVFHAVGPRLVPWSSLRDAHPSLTTAFDTGAHRAVQLRLPAGYRADGADFRLFEWVDDDTIALASAHAWSSADILTCRLSDGRCDLAVKAREGAGVRIVPQQALPG